MLHRVNICILYIYSANGLTQEIDVYYIYTARTRPERYKIGVHRPRRGIRVCCSCIGPINICMLYVYIYTYIYMYIYIYIYIYIYSANKASAQNRSTPGTPRDSGMLHRVNIGILYIYTARTGSPKKFMYIIYIQREQGLRGAE